MKTRTILAILFIVTLTAFTTTFAGATCVTLDTVDIGDPTSEAGHNLIGWGPIEPATSGGTYGGIVDCRPVYAPEDGDDWATIDLDFGDDPTTCKSFNIHHLDGHTADSFDVYIDGVLVHSYAGDGLTTEHWYQLDLEVCLTGVRTVKFVSTAPKWGSWDTYGQMCFDILEVQECPSGCTMLDMVDIGDGVSEGTHSMSGWGPVEPATSGGSYGGIDNCRPVYATEDGTPWATVALDFGDDPTMPKCITLHHLEGIGNDAFDLYIQPQDRNGLKKLIYSFPGDAQTSETWMETSVIASGIGMQTLTIESTAPKWSNWDTYGQMCFDIIRVDECPAEKAVVDIGDPASEAAFNMVGWGPIEPGTSGGGYGGIDNCRPIYAPEDGDDWATIDFDFGCCEGLKCLVMEHLDGLGDDAFEVYMYPAGDPTAAQLIYTYPGDGLDTEIWKTSGVLVEGTGLQTIKFVSTEPQWSGWPTYGQMCFNKLMLRSYQPVMDNVIIGDTGSEAGHAMAGWGPIEPATSGGNYGGAEQCRPIYAPEDNDNWATIEMDFGYCTEDTKCLVLDHLDGIASDSFDVYIYPPGGTRPATPDYSYAGNSLTTEIWYRSCFAVTANGRQVVELVSTEAIWDDWDIYGQVCFREIGVESCEPHTPQPYVLYPAGVDVQSVPESGHITSIAPNPFNPKTEISFAMNVDARAELVIYDLQGRAVATLVDDILTAGPYKYAWYGFDAAGRQVSSGVYFASLKIGGRTIQVEKVSMIK